MEPTWLYLLFFDWVRVWHLLIRGLAGGSGMLRCVRKEKLSYAGAARRRRKPTKLQRIVVSRRQSRLRQALLDFEGQAEFGDVQGPGQRAVGQLLDTAQAVAHGVGMTKDLRRGVVSGAALLQPRLERVEQDRALRGRQFFQSA